MDGLDFSVDLFREGSPPSNKGLLHDCIFIAMYAMVIFLRPDFDAYHKIPHINQASEGSHWSGSRKMFPLELNHS